MISWYNLVYEGNVSNMHNAMLPLFSWA